MILKDYFEFVESKRRHDLTELNKKYKLIGPLITKVEGLVCGTNTSRTPKMVTYYAYWEKEIYNTIYKVLIRSINEFFFFNILKNQFQIDSFNLNIRFYNDCLILNR